jgi:biotin operon repressor
MRIHGYDKILNYLKLNKATYHEIAEKTGLSYDGVRGRISELRKLGFPIEKKDDKFYIKEKGKQLIPFEFEIVTSPSGYKSLAVSMPLEFSKNAPSQEVLITEFQDIINKIKQLLTKIESNRKTKKDKKLDVELNWEIGNILLNYQNSLIKKGLYCWNYEEKVLEEFVKEHRREYWRVRKEFRRMYPNKDKLLPIGFNTYNEIIVVSDPEKRKKLEQFVKKEFEKTGKSPSVNSIREKRWEIGGTKRGRSN